MTELSLRSKPFGSEPWVRATRPTHPGRELKAELLSLKDLQQAKRGDKVRVTRREDKAMANEISAERAAFLVQDYSQGFIKYCQIEGEVRDS